MGNSMILYDQDQKESYVEFGIEIPISGDKKARIFHHLMSRKDLAEKVRNWHIDKIYERISKADLLRVHSPQYVENLCSERLEDEIIRAYELIDSSGKPHRYNPAGAKLPLRSLFGRILNKVAGTYQCCKVALDKKFCFYFGGGMHHAQRGFGNGFCLVNDVVIAIRRLQAEGYIRTAWVIDVDVHKGDGTAALTEGDASVKTLSTHMARGWPLDGKPYDEKGLPNPSFIPSDIDIPIEEGEEPVYLARLAKGLQKMAETPEPDLAVVLLGADPYEKDELPSTGLLNLSLEQLMERDILIYRFLKDRSIPGAFLMAGGYGKGSWKVYAQFLEWALLDRFC